MNKNAKRQINPYQKASIETASPGKIILMLYDGALRFLTQAKEGFELEDTLQRNQTVNNNIIKVLNIVAELKSVLDHKADPKFAKTLDDLYAYVYNRLSQCNIRKDKTKIPEAEKILKDLRDAWAEMLLQQEETKPKITSLSHSA